MSTIILLLIACGCFMGYSIISRFEQRQKRTKADKIKANIEERVRIDRNIAVLQVELPRRRKIFDESVTIIQKTNNPDVLLRRMDVVRDFVRWAFEQQANGLPIKLDKNREQSQEDANRFCNFHIVRVAHYVSKHTRKNVFTNLIRLRSALNESENKDEAYNEITTLIKE